MEAAAVGEVAQRFDVPYMAIKSITNLLNENLHADFLKNYKVAVENLAEKISLLIPKIFGRTPSEICLEQKQDTEKPILTS